MGAPLNNNNAGKNRPWSDAINRALLANDGKKLRALAEKLIDKALEGDVPAIKEIGDRVEGRPHQTVATEVSGPDGSAIPIEMRPQVTPEEWMLKHGLGPATGTTD